MNIILLSGGSGKRLWPLSNEVRSKQFLKIVSDENDKMCSMLQRVYFQLKKVGLGKHVIIATSAAQQESITSQLGNQVDIVVEPERRNTYPAVLLACCYLILEKGCSLEDDVIVIPVDPYVSDSYYTKIEQLGKLVRNKIVNLALMGVLPTYPSEKYGYILPGEKREEYFTVKGFKEKPDKLLAQNLIQSGGLWNCGVFGFRLDYIWKKANEVISISCYSDIVRQYSKLKNTSFDYEIVEKETSIAVVPYSGEWKDLGTWNTLTEVMKENTMGNVILSQNCYNTHVINELELPIVVMGATNMIIAASPDGILVADKNESSYLKIQVEHIHQRPMFEERVWGDYKVLDIASGIDGIKSLTKRKKIKAGAKIEYQLHRNRSEVWTVLSGKCIITVNDRAHEAFAGDTFSIGEGVKHGLKAISDVELLEVQFGKELINDGTEVATKTPFWHK